MKDEEYLAGEALFLNPTAMKVSTSSTENFDFEGKEIDCDSHTCKDMMTLSTMIIWRKVRTLFPEMLLKRWKSNFAFSLELLAYHVMVSRRVDSASRSRSSSLRKPIQPASHHPHHPPILPKYETKMQEPSQGIQRELVSPRPLNSQWRIADFNPLS